MKSFKNILKTFLVMAAVLAFGQARAQKADVAEIKNLVESGKYTFKPQTVIPSVGGSRFVTSEYELLVSKDTLESFLPYFGRAFTAPVNPTESGLRFTSTNFDSKTEKNKRGWTITIKPGDARDVRQLILFVSPTGYATLQVLSNNRQPISFSGYIASK
jgi:hypothetical protein